MAESVQNNIQYINKILAGDDKPWIKKNTFKLHFHKLCSDTITVLLNCYSIGVSLQTKMSMIMIIISEPRRDLYCKKFK